MLANVLPACPLDSEDARVGECTAELRLLRIRNWELVSVLGFLIVLERGACLSLMGYDLLGVLHAIFGRLQGVFKGFM